MAEELLALDVVAAAEAIAAGALDPAELFACYRSRAEAEEGRPDRLNCFCYLEDEPRFPQPVKQRFPVPVAVKDLFCTAGRPSQAGSRLLADYRPPYSATAVKKLEAAGVPLLGKTNQDEFAMGSSNEHCAFGAVRNPWDRSRVPGGSSGGSAAAVAAALVPWALGSDTGGSVRQPAALCGIVGLKPTYGAVSRYGMIAFASSLDQAGALTRTVADAALMIDLIAGQDPADATSVGLPGPLPLPRADRLEEPKERRPLRFGIPVELSAKEGEGVEAGVLAAFERAVSVARELGAEVKGVALPHARHALSAYYVLAPAEASSNLARYDGVRYGRRVEARELQEMYERTREEGFGVEVKRRIMLGTYVLSAGYYDAYYAQAQRVRTLILEDFKRAFGEVDLLLTPTTAEVAFKLGAKRDNPWAMYMNDYFTVPMSLAGIPALSIPCGLARVEGVSLPVGLQLAGPHFSEPLLVEAGHALEKAIAFDGRPAWV